MRRFYSAVDAAPTCSLSPVLGGEGWGEGPGVKLRNPPELPLTLTPPNPPSSAYRGEGTGEFSHRSFACTFRSAAIRSITPAQSPRFVWRNNRIVGYHGLSGRPNCQRQSGM